MIPCDYNTLIAVHHYNFMHWWVSRHCIALHCNRTTPQITAFIGAGGQSIPQYCSHILGLSPPSKHESILAWLLDQWPHFIAPANNNISSVLNLSRIDKSARHWRLPGASVDFPEVAAMANNRTLNDSDARRPHKTDPLLDQFQSAGCTRVIVGCRYVCQSVLSVPEQRHSPWT